MFRTTITLAACLAISAGWSQSVTVTEAVTLAFANRPAIAAARADLEQAKRQARASSAYPSTVLGLGLSSRADLGATDQDLYISQPLDVFGRTSASREQAKASVAVAEADFRQTLVNVQTEVLNRYFETAVAQRYADVSAELLVLAESLYKATSRRFEEGKIPEVQLTRAKIELDLARQAAALRRASLAASQRLFQSTLGTPELPLTETLAELQPLATPTLEDRPELVSLASQVLAAQANQSSARRSRLPEVELVGLRSPWRGGRTEYGARIQLTMALWDHGRGRDEELASARQADAARSRLAEARAKAQAELDALDIERSAAADQLASILSIQVSARSLVEKSQRGYSEGVGTLIDVLEATRSLREIEQQLAEARLNLNLIEVRRYELAGVLLGGVN